MMMWIAALAAALGLAGGQPQAGPPPGQPTGQAPTGQPPGGRGGVVIGSPRDAYPERAPEDPEAVARGKALYSVNCQFCHGADIRGGDGGPSLLRSGDVLADQKGEKIGSIVQNGRPGGMPKFTLTNVQVGDIAAFLHTFRAAGYDESRNKPPSILVGDAKLGEQYFKTLCVRCHSIAGDLQGIATRIADPRMLQQTWLMPGSGGGRGAPPPVKAPPARVRVLLPTGEKLEGELDRIDDFNVSLKTRDGRYRSYRTMGTGITVEIIDPLQPHRDMLREIKDADIHNLTAYLVTLK
jgi:mono/diheme cytochrome c family protein